MHVTFNASNAPQHLKLAQTLSRIPLLYILYLYFHHITSDTYHLTSLPNIKIYLHRSNYLTYLTVSVETSTLLVLTMIFHLARSYRLTRVDITSTLTYYAN